MLIAAAVGLLVAAASWALAAPPEARPGKDQLTAAYLYNFLKYVSWPENMNEAALVVCVVGAPGVYGVLVHDINGTQLGARSVVVRSIGAMRADDDCSLVYVDATVAPASDIWLIAAPHVLTVSDRKDYVRHGGMIELFDEGKRLRFNINLSQARSLGLRVSAPLLQLAARVEQE